MPFQASNLTLHRPTAAFAQEFGKSLLHSFGKVLRISNIHWYSVLSAAAQLSIRSIPGFHSVSIPLCLKLEVKCQVHSHAAGYTDTTKTDAVANANLYQSESVTFELKSVFNYVIAFECAVYQYINNKIF